MSQALSNLLTLLNLEKIEEGLFRGQSEDLGLRQVFGGQVVGQAEIHQRDFFSQHTAHVINEYQSRCRILVAEST